MVFGNCKVKCIAGNLWENNFTIGEIYEVINGKLKCDTGYVYEPFAGDSPVRYLKSWYTFEILDCDDLICDVCGEPITRNDYMNHRGTIVCNHCKENLQYCSECGRVILDDDIEYVNGATLCTRCFERYYIPCDYCGEIHYRYDMYTAQNGDCVCENCRDEYFYECVECGELIHRDNVYWDGDNAYCDECYDEHKYKCINGYYFKPAPIFHGRAPVHNPLYMGVELEIDGGGESHANAQRLLDIANEYDEHIYCKHDGSLNYGFEIVSHPATLDYHMNDIAWAEIMKTALNMEYRSHDTETCGLHIHVSRNALGDTFDKRDETISKIVYFVENNWDEILRFTRRSESNLRRWASRYGIETNAKATYEKAKRERDRYHCINLENDNTIEFRMFRGTLKYTTFVATLQLVHEICNICKRSSVERIESMEWNDFIEYIDQTEFPQLVEYLKIRGLYNLNV